MKPQQDHSQAKSAQQGAKNMNNSETEWKKKPQKIVSKFIERWRLFNENHWLPKAN